MARDTWGTQGDLADQARVSRVEGAEGRSHRWDQIDGSPERQRARVGVDAAQAEGVADEELDGVGVGARPAQLGHEALAEGVVRALPPDLGADLGALPGAGHVAGSCHAFTVAAPVTAARDEELAAWLGSQVLDQVPRHRDRAAAHLLAALAQLATYAEAGIDEVDVVPGQRHRLLDPKPREPEHRGEVALPAAQRGDAGVHLGPGGRHGRSAGLVLHAELPGRRDLGSGLVVVVQPRPGELNYLDDLAAGGLGPVAAVQPVVGEVGVEVGEQLAGEERGRERAGTEVPEEQVQRAGVADRRVRLEHAGAVLGVVPQEAAEIRRWTSITRLPSPSEGDRVLDLGLEPPGGRLRRALPAPRFAVRVAPAHAPASVALVDARHRFTSIHQRSTSPASQRYAGRRAEPMFTQGCSMWSGLSFMRARKVFGSTSRWTRTRLCRHQVDVMPAGFGAGSFLAAEVTTAPGRSPSRRGPLPARRTAATRRPCAGRCGAGAWSPSDHGGRSSGRRPGP